MKPSTFASWRPHGKRTVLEPWHVDMLSAEPVGAWG